MIDKKFHAKKSLGQNFLIDKDIISHIVESAQITKEDEVIEIGPGQGALTKALLLKAKHVTAYEVDNYLIETLKEKILDTNFTLINQDFLKSDLDYKKVQKLVANIPYYITSDILFKIFYNKEKFSSVTLMVQEEVADRITAKPNESSYNKLSVVSQYFAEVKKLFSIPPSAFNPKPKVSSAIIHFNFKKTEFKTKKEEKNFLDFIKKCFQMRRKTLVNNLKGINQDILLKFLADKGHSKSARAQELGVQDFIHLFNLVK